MIAVDTDILVYGHREESERREALLSGRIAGPQVHDGRIAALCLQHGVNELWSADRDFGRFSSLTVLNPLVA